MPAFIKTPHDEQKWNEIKRSVAKQKGKNVADFTDKDWAEVNGIFHKCEELVKAISTKVPSTSIPSPTKMESTVVKLPKASKMPDPLGKPSLFFKTENCDFDGIKHATLRKLRDFIQKKHK